jgi:hypothetical protein
MSYIQYKIGASPAYVKSFRWVKPGIAEAVIVQEAVKVGEAMPTMPATPIPMIQDAFHEEFTDGIGVRRWIYRSGNSTPFVDDSGDSNVWSADVSLMENPIHMHPKIDAIMKKYGGVFKNGTIQFPPYQADGSVNPMYMVETYFAPTMTVSYESINNASPSVSNIGDLGYIDTPGPNAFSFCSQGDWLLVGHEISRQGNESVERKTWKYGGPGGWVEQIYKKNYWG